MTAPSIRHLYPFESKFLDIDGARMHYVDEGSGPTIVFVHGNPTWSFYFRDLIKGLRDQYRVIAVDHVGCGLSDKPQHYPYTLATHIENFSQLIEYLKLDRVTLGVHDWGGPIGLGWAVKNPQRIERLVVFNTAAFLGGKMPFRIRVCGWPFVGSFLVRGLNGFCRAAVYMACQDRTRMTRDVAAGYLSPYDSWRNRVAIHRFVRDIPYSDRVPSFGVFQEIESKLSTLRGKSMTIFWGMRDFCFTHRFLAQWQQVFPEAAIHRFEKAGHYVVEDANEQILTALRCELAQTQETPGRVSVELENEGRSVARSSAPAQ